MDARTIWARRLIRLLVAFAFALWAWPSVAATETAPQAPLQCHDFVGWDGRLHLVCIGQGDFVGDVCDAIATYAWANRLPQAYLARLIWQESRFDPNALSPAGAQGIAQFMPGTAHMRGLPNAFQPAKALAYSAEYLRELADRFGNLGLAAAAYNAGEGRVSRYINGGTLPSETRAYVRIVTGQPADLWLSDGVSDADYALDPGESFDAACRDMAKAVPVPILTAVQGDWRPWGVLLAQNFNPGISTRQFDRVVARYDDVLRGERLLMLTVRNPSFGRRLRHSAMIGRDSRAEADELCQALRRAGGSCIVVRN